MYFHRHHSASKTIRSLIQEISDYILVSHILRGDVVDVFCLHHDVFDFHTDLQDCVTFL